ncbi:MAG: hypothetical protein KF889_14360 [Alphaproteobacteria bacterium]|nr:hypothetical protein [Alphaproteobacteria bacterium]MCW5738819.1 hypothetical protein [Alphaproteobacteria bacterium]
MPDIPNAIPNSNMIRYNIVLIVVFPLGIQVMRGAAFALLLLLLPSLPSPATGQASVAAWRGVVADHATGRLWIVDLATGRILATEELRASARLHRGASGRYVVATLPSADEVRLVDSGVVLEGHDDHRDIAIGAPRLLRPALSGRKPSHISTGHRDIAVFFDGDGMAVVLDEDAFARGDVSRQWRVASGAPHHGAAVPVGRQLAISVPTPSQALPDAVVLRDRTDQPKHRLECPKLHGEARSGAHVAFGCADGIAVYEQRRVRLAAVKLAYPPDIADGRKVRWLDGALGYSLFFGDFGPRAVVSIDPGRVDGFAVIDLPGRRIAQTLLHDPGDTAFVLMESGELVRIDTLNARITHRTGATGRYAANDDTARPRLSAAGPFVAVSDPAAGEIVVLDATTLAERRRIRLGGTPFDIVVTGGSGRSH